jgi:hypothetical protein
MNNEITFKRKASNNNGIVTINIPTELAEFTEIKPGDEISFSGYEKKRGKFIAIWKEKKQEE